MASDAVHLWLILWRAYDAVRAHADRHIHSLGVGFSDFAVLEALLHKGPLPVNSIGAKVHLTSGSITAAVDRLEAKDLVSRCSLENDRRARMVHLTEKGRELIQYAFADHAAAIEHAVAGLTTEERRHVTMLLKKLGLKARDLLT